MAKKKPKKAAKKKVDRKPRKPNTRPAGSVVQWIVTFDGKGYTALVVECDVVDVWRKEPGCVGFWEFKVSLATGKHMWSEDRDRNSIVAASRVIEVAAGWPTPEAARAYAKGYIAGIDEKAKG